MTNIKMLFLASALSLGTTAVMAQVNSVAPGKNATGTVNSGSSGAANSRNNVNSNAAENAGSQKAYAGATKNKATKRKQVMMRKQATISKHKTSTPNETTGSANNRPMAKTPSASGLGDVIGGQNVEAGPKLNQ